MKNNDKIKALSDREQARLKLPVFYGSRDNYLHGVREVIGNSIDEIINNFDSGEINVKLNNNIITVMDTGRGLPINNKGDEVLLFEKMFAGTKYDESDNVSIGTNGLGNTVLNYTSKFFKATVYTKDKVISIMYTDGGQNKQMSTEKNHTPIRGTRIEFELDPECYTNTIFKEEEIEEIVKHFSATTDKINFIFNGKKYHYDSIEDYLDENLKNQIIKPYHYEMDFDDGDEKNNYEIVFSASAEPIQETYLNNTYLIENGSIYNGFIKEFTNSVNKLSKEMKLRKAKDSDYTEKDIENVVSFVVKCNSNRVEYANQTKFSTNKRLYNTQIKQVVKNMIELYANANKQEFKKLVEALNKVHDVNTKAQKVAKQIKKTLQKSSESFSTIPKLVDCKEHGENAELFICEGDSAAGSIVLARDNKSQVACFPVKGKVKNIYELSTLQALENEELSSIIKILGCGIYNTVNNKNEVEINDLKYGKIIIAADSDSDGYHIASLLITFFNKFIPEIIEQGYLYLLISPLYVITFKDGTQKYLYTESEYKEFKENNKLEIKKVERNKGIGEIDAEEMNKYAINKDTRKIVQVKKDEKLDNILRIWFNKKDRTDRKERILNGK